ncbi:MAG: EF-P lysine aminoacylase GenX [Gammaproteobacteria bacterium]|nr:EF-P lysine aminoacylase GenX [Gammaproteobacteria bacterium]
MTWRPNAGVEIARARASMIRRARRYFDDQDVLEVFTPALSRNTVTDPNIDSVVASVNNSRYYLHTSPEYRMKQLLAAGFPDIYQVCRVFRNAESGRWHQQEFTMIEWYRRGYDLDSIAADAMRLITGLLDSRPLEPPKKISYSDAFKKKYSIDPLTAPIAELVDIAVADDALQQSIGDNRDAWLDLVFADRISPHFEDDRLTVIYHYPASQAALARRCPQDPEFADRFEIYLGAIELANGFVELTDADEQLTRFEKDRMQRVTDGKPEIAIDPGLIDALRAGLPECAGVALGLDRLLMIAEGLNDITEVMTFTPGGSRGR